MLTGRDDRLAPGAAAVGIARVEIAAEFRGNDQRLPAARMAADMVPDNLLRMALGVEVRGVKLPPSSMYLSRIFCDSSTVEPQPRSSPKVMVPRQNGLTRRP